MLDFDENWYPYVKLVIKNNYKIHFLGKILNFDFYSKNRFFGLQVILHFHLNIPKWGVEILVLFFLTTEIILPRPHFNTFQVLISKFIGSFMWGFKLFVLVKQNKWPVKKLKFWIWGGEGITSFLFFSGFSA